VEQDQRLAGAAILEMHLEPVDVRLRHASNATLGGQGCRKPS
jgi:hypothetical protein